MSGKTINHDDIHNILNFFEVFELKSSPELDSLCQHLLQVNESQLTSSIRGELLQVFRYTLNNSYNRQILGNNTVDLLVQRWRPVDY